MVSSWSKDPSTKVGAVVANGNKVISLGFNGFPPSIQDNEEWLNDRPTKYSLTIHAEANALHFAGDRTPGCTLYCYPLFPCAECSKLIVLGGIQRVVTRLNRSQTGTSTFLDPRPAWEVFSRAGVEFEVYEC